MRYDCLINITCKNIHISDTWLTLYPVVYFSIACSKSAWTASPLCEHKQGNAFSIHWQRYR